MTQDANENSKKAEEKPAEPVTGKSASMDQSNENPPSNVGNQLGTPTPKQNPSNPFSFFKRIESLLENGFRGATVGQKALILAMCLGAVLFVGLGIWGMITGRVWALVIMFSLAILLIFAAPTMLFLVEQRALAPFRCRHVPIFPPDESSRIAIKDGLEEIRSDAVAELQRTMPAIPDDRIRANIFMLARIRGGDADDKWKLVIHPDFAINMNHMPELHLQLSIGQGATGVAYKDGNYHFTRRLSDPKKGNWQQKFQMTPEVSEQIHKKLQWIVSFPLWRSGTRESIGVLNIDGLIDVPDDDAINEMASRLREKVEVIANHLSLQPSTCVGFDQLGIM